ncbi:MAG: hypothetical protein H7Y00_12835 [Fimbriimonadaceae bacterium]|nr:hypothetical protein [Chitinophagales bacterium]
MEENNLFYLASGSLIRATFAKKIMTVAEAGKKNYSTTTTGNQKMEIL